jgi:hypothetical protein
VNNVTKTVSITRIAAGWLYLVAAATALNSLVLFKYDRFVDLIVGLSFTQFIDAVFVGMSMEPKGAPWLLTAGPAFIFDIPIILLLLVLAVKTARRRKRAAQVSFWLYAMDTFVFVLMFATDIVLHEPARTAILSGLTLIGHTVGLFVLFRAWQQVQYTSTSA